MAARVLEHIRIGSGGQLLGASRKDDDHLPKYYLCGLAEKEWVC